MLFFIFVPFITKDNFIRDSEIEETIMMIINPIISVFDLKNIKIFIIDGQTTNAFSASRENIFIYSGLIINFPDPDVLMVIAHDIGYILWSTYNT